MKSQKDKMTQIFILGASGVYGVGAEQASWADLVKQAFHKKMYSAHGTGEKYEVYNFGKSGAKIDFVLKAFPALLKAYGRGGKIITILALGGNNAKAENEPDNYVSTLEGYRQEMATLLDLLKKLSSHVIAVGGGFYDEAKTNPKHNPLTGGKSYFNNQRKQQFEACFKELCQEREIPFVNPDVTEDVWKKSYLFSDGLHANQSGHKLISEKVLLQLGKLNL